MPKIGGGGRGWRWLAAFVLGCAACGLAAWGAVALFAGGAPEGGGSSAGFAFSSGGLFEPLGRGVASVAGGGSSGSVVAAAVRKPASLVNLDAARAARVDREVFAAQFERPAGGPPALPRGQRLVRFESPRVAQIALPRGPHGRRVAAAVSSTQPMAVETSPNHFAPVDLALKRMGGVFGSVRPLVGVVIGRHAGEGVVVPQTGVSITPVSASGAPLGGAAGEIDGASILFANTQASSDTQVKPTTTGFAINTILRAASGSRRLYYRVGLPSGARLVQTHAGTGPVQVLEGERTLGMLLPPTAVDSTGGSVPVTMSLLGGNLLSVSVQDAGDYPPPISVDPEYYTAEDRGLTGGVFPVEAYKGGTNWVPDYTGAFTEAAYKKSYSCGSESYWCDQSWYIEPSEAYNGAEHVGLQYKTQGDSTIYNLEMWAEGYNEPSETTTEVEYNYGPNGEDDDETKVLSGGSKQGEYKDEPIASRRGTLTIRWKRLSTMT